jgi:hypothetical protein
MHEKNNAIGFLCGISGGCLQYLQINIHAAFLAKLMEAGTTALVCGAAGILGKEIVTHIKLKYFTKKIKP